jgi:hypothetical protein
MALLPATVTSVQQLPGPGFTGIIPLSYQVQDIYPADDLYSGEYGVPALLTTAVVLPAPSP